MLSLIMPKLNMPLTAHGRSLRWILGQVQVLRDFFDFQIVKGLLWNQSIPPVVSQHQSKNQAWRL